MNYGKLTAGTTKTAIDTAKLSEKGEIITYLSRMGDVLKKVTNRSQLIFTFGGIDVVRNGYQADIVFREELLHEPSHLNVVTAQPGKAFDKQSGCLALLQLAHHFIKAGAVHGNAGNAVVNESDDIGIAHVLCHLGQQLFLRRDLSRYVFVKKCAIRIDKQQKERYNNVVIDNDVII